MPSNPVLILVDAVGGGLAAMAAAIAKSMGRANVSAATSHSTVSVPDEVRTALAEIGLEPSPVVHLDAKDREGESILVVDASWGASLYGGRGQLERLSNARIARDRIEHRLEQMLRTLS